MFGAYNQKLPHVPASVTRDGGVANTSVVFHSGRLLALEEAHPPTEINLATLDTLGYYTFGGAVSGPFTAHPKVDPLTGDLLFFSYNANGPITSAMSYGIVNRLGEVTKLEYFKAPYPAMVHDFIVTANHVAIPILPLCGNIWRAVRGGEPYAWDPSKPSLVGVMKRSETARDMIWFEGDPCFVFHVMNAWEANDQITALVMQSEEPPLFPHVDGRAAHSDNCRARLARWTFDLASNSNAFKQEYLDDIGGELPRIDERRVGLLSDHGWYATIDPGRPLIGGLSGLMHVNSRGARRGQYRLPGHDTISEPIFVPRSNNSAEGDGWLLSVIWRAAENRSDLAIFEAGGLEAGPIALVQLAHRVPDGFHGTWVPAVH
jgi:carotenoid cleavage dioxygenase